MEETRVGYSPVAKALHWLTFATLVVQFVVGYSIDRADDLLEVVVDRWLHGEEEGLLVFHVVLGVAILALTVARLLWRKFTGLPPWAEGLSAFERRLAHRTEQVLYAMLFAIPLSGIALVLVSGEDWEWAGGYWQAPLEWIDDDLLLGAHILFHVVFFLGFLAHVGLVAKHQILDRDHLLRRML